MAHPINRREFLKRSALAGLAAGALRLRAEDAPAPKSANDKLNVAFIGANGKGMANLAGVAATGMNIVALCDIDSERLKQPADKYKCSNLYSDFRKMLEQKDIDAVVISTPDHTHAVAAMAAMKLGKHVYVEKPLCHDISEVRALQAAAKKYKVASQMGNQGTASEQIRKQAELVRSGAVGAIREVHVWSDRPGRYWPQGVNRPADTPAIPANVAWDLWLGPAPERPYHPAYHPFKWRGFWDFGTGALGDMGCHIINYPNFALKLSSPESVECIASEGATQESPPNWAQIRWSFAARDNQPAFSMTWHDGGKMPSKPANLEAMPGNGVMYVGEKGTILCTYGNGPKPKDGAKASALTDKIAKGEAVIIGQEDSKAPEPSIARSKGHYVEWVEACKGGAPAGSNFEYAAPLTEIVLLGNIAMRAGKKIEWNSAEMKVTNLAEANAFLKREYRKGWEL